jgi:hypothetical protein
MTFENKKRGTVAALFYARFFVLIFVLIFILIFVLIFVLDLPRSAITIGATMDGLISLQLQAFPRIEFGTCGQRTRACVCRFDRC